MLTRNQLVQFRRISLTWSAVFGILLSTFGFGNLPSVSAQGTITNFIPAGELTLIPGTVTVSKDIEDAIILTLKNADSVLAPEIRYFAVTDVYKDGKWEFISIIGLVEFDENVGWFLEDGAWFGVVLLTNDGQENWYGAMDGTSEFSTLLQEIPNNILGEKEKRNIDSLSQSTTDSFSTYIFPWQVGTKMFYGSAGIHENGFSGVVSGWKAVDMLSDGDTAAGHAPNRLLASETATINYVCNDGTSVAVRMGNFFYTHLVYNTNLYYGKTFNQGDEMGQMKSGTFSENCGYANQGSNWFHVHWGFPNSDLPVGDWTLSMTTQNWTNGSTTISPGNGWITSGSSGGSGPSGFTFCANESGYCSFSGTADVAYGANGSFNYKYAVSNGINCDNATFGDPIYGTSKACYYKLTTPPQTCPAVSGIARLFDDQVCGGSSIDAGLGLLQLEQNGFNDMAESIAVPNGWSARLYLHNSESSPSLCINTTDTNLGDNTYSDGTNVANQTTWVRVYDNSSCSGGTPPNAPTLTSPLIGASFKEGEEIILTWSATGTEYYGEVWGGPGGTLSFGWQTGTSKNIGAQWSGYQYLWHVKARNSAGESGWSPTWAFTVYPGTPTNVNASSISCSQINLAWSDNSGSEEGYKVYRNGSLIATLGSNVTSYQDTGLTGDTSYSYTITAYRGNIESNSSNTATASTSACQPDLVPNPREGHIDSVTVSSESGTASNNTLYAGKPIYMDWGFKNASTTSISANYYVDLYIDNQRFVHYPFTSLCAGCQGGFDDWMETWNSPGWHTVRLVVDPENTIAESDESNNEWSKQFFWVGYDLTVHKPGTGNGTVTSIPTGINCGSDCSESYAFNTTVTLTATAGAGSTFDGWNGGGCSGTSTCTVTMTTATSVTASFNVQTSSYTLDVNKIGTGNGTVISNPSGVDCGSTCSYSFGDNTPVTLTATADTGSTFIGWSGGGCSGTGTCTVTMTEDTSVTASFDDTTNPDVTWIAPVSDEQVYNVTNQVIQLEVSATDNISIDRVVFLRWDYVDLQYIQIGAASNAPYLVDFNTGSLLPDWNYIVAYAFDASGRSSSQYIWLNHINPPGAFDKSGPLNGATNQSTNPTLVWEASTGTASYEYCYDTTNDNACSNWTSNGNSTSKSMSGLSAGTTYYWHVRAVNTAGTTYANGDSTAFWSFTTAPNLPNPPAAPSNLSTTAVSQSEIDLTWADNSTDEDGFEMERSPDGSTGWTQIGTLIADTTSYSDTGLSSGTTYYYRIRAFNVAGNSTYSNISNTSTPDSSNIDQLAIGEINVVGNVNGSYLDTQINDGTTQSIIEVESGGKPSKRYSYLEHKWLFNVQPGEQVTFKANVWAPPSSDGDTFVFAYSDDDANFVNMFDVVTTADDDNYYTFTLPASISGTVYIRVRDTNRTQGNRSLDTIFIDHIYIQGGNVSSEPPSAPTSLTATTEVVNQISLNWTDNATNESGFELERSLDGANWELIDTVDIDTTTFTDVDLASNTTYYYRVRAINYSGASSYSNTADATTPQLITMHVGDLDGIATSGDKNRWDVAVTIVIHSADENPVVGATISGSWSGGVSGIGTCITDATGQCTIIKANLKNNLSSITFTITNVAQDTFVYQPADNHDPDGDSDGNTLTIQIP